MAQRDEVVETTVGNASAEPLRHGGDAHDLIVIAIGKEEMIPGRRGR